MTLGIFLDYLGFEWLYWHLWAQIEFECVEWKTKHTYFSKKEVVWLSLIFHQCYLQALGRTVWQRDVKFFPGRVLGFCCNYRLRASTLSGRRWLLCPWAVAVWRANTRALWAGRQARLFICLNSGQPSSGGEMDWSNRCHHSCKRLVWIGIWWESGMKPVCSYFSA